MIKPTSYPVYYFKRLWSTFKLVIFSVVQEVEKIPTTKQKTKNNVNLIHIFHTNIIP